VPCCNDGERAGWWATQGTGTDRNSASPQLSPLLRNHDLTQGYDWLANPLVRVHPQTGQPSLWPSVGVHACLPAPRRRRMMVAGGMHDCTRPTPSAPFGVWLRPPPFLSVLGPDEMRSLTSLLQPGDMECFELLHPPPPDDGGATAAAGHPVAAAMGPAESHQLLSRLLEPGTQPEHVYSHEWRVSPPAALHVCGYGGQPPLCALTKRRRELLGAAWRRGGMG
jgi:hypothetical protein